MRVISLNNGLEPAVDAARRVIGAGGVIVYPTDTVYGVGCDATNASAVERIGEMKRREGNMRFIVLADSFHALKRLADDLTADMEAIIEKLVPAPVTFVVKSSGFASATIKGCEETIAIRIPDYDFCLRLCSVCGVPLLSTSANLHGESVGTAIATISKEVLEKADLTIDGGALSNVPSTVVDATGKAFRILREGALTREQLLRRSGGMMAFAE